MILADTKSCRDTSSLTCYSIFVQFMQFPVLDFGVGHSGYQPFNYACLIVVGIQAQCSITSGMRRASVSECMRWMWNSCMIVQLGLHVIMQNVIAPEAV